MRTTHLLALSATLALGAVAGASCSSSVGGGSGGGGSDGGSLRWYTSCGDPVCNTQDAGPPSGVAPCTTEKEGDPCTTAGAKCDAGLGCGVLLVCAASDPKLAPGGCPISRARYKKDIAYVADERLAALHDEVMEMRLATWRYKTEPDGARTHLGFIIDDDPASPGVDATGDRVDLYGYTSMAVAAAQVQGKRIASLEREIAALREEIAALRAARASCEAR
jgi:hypothetical protein